MKPTKKVSIPNSGRIRMLCYNVAKDKHGKFAQFITAINVINVIVMATESQSYKNLPDGTLQVIQDTFWSENLRESIHALFSFLYMIEIGIKIIGLGWEKVIHPQMKDC